MKKIYFIFISLLMILLTVSCTTGTTNDTCTVTLINGVIKDTNVSTQEVNIKDIIVVIPSENTDDFIGWYENGVLVSEKKEYTIQVEKDITLEAKFGSTKGLKNGYYILTNKVENALDLTESFVFNALLFSNNDVTWYEVDYSGSKEQKGTVEIEGNTINISIGIKKYTFTANSDFTTLSFNNKINRVEVSMTYIYQEGYKMSTESGKVNFTDELFGDDINKNFYNYCPSIMIENGTTMHIWYCSNKENAKVVDYVAYRKGTLTPDGKWTFTEKELVLGPTDGTWDEVHTCDPSVVKGNFKYNNEEYNYLMAYLGCATYDCTINEVGIAVAKQPNGPFIKIDEINPIANFNQKIIEQGNTDEWKKSWGYGQPSLVSIDKAGKVMLFYSAGTPKSTHTVAEEWDLRDLNNPIKISSTDVSNIGVTSASGGIDVINNADFAYDPATKRLICVKEDFPYPSDGGTNWIPSSNTLMYFELDADEVSPLNTLAVNPKKTWISFGTITKNATGYPRNHNCGLVTDEYGWVLSSTKLPVVYTMSMVSNDFPNWDKGGQWPALHTYRLHGIVVDLPR